MGAPLPKELHKAKHIYPLLFVVKKSDPKSLAELFKKIENTEIESVSSDKLAVYFGQSAIIIENKKTETKFAEEILHNLIFFKEYESQFEEYLELHRIIWEDVSAIRESNSLRYKDFSPVRSKLLDFLKTLSYVSARLGQMGHILDERETLIADDLKNELVSLRLNSFGSLRASQQYINELWGMTLSYTQETLGLLDTLYEENG